jgi:putative endonuclease
MNCYVYILKGADGSYYTGITSNLERRLFEHNNRIKSCLQKSKVPVELACCELYNSRIDAAKREKEIKGWSRIKKENLINSLKIVK